MDWAILGCIMPATEKLSSFTERLAITIGRLHWVIRLSVRLLYSLSVLNEAIYRKCNCWRAIITQNKPYTYLLHSVSGVRSNHTMSTLMEGFWQHRLNLVYLVNYNFLSFKTNMNSNTLKWPIIRSAFSHFGQGTI